MLKTQVAWTVLNRCTSPTKCILFCIEHWYTVSGLFMQSSKNTFLFNLSAPPARRHTGWVHWEALQLSAGWRHHPALLCADPAGSLSRPQQAHSAPGPQDPEHPSGQAPDDRQDWRLRHLQDTCQQEQGLHCESARYWSILWLHDWTSTVQ